VIEPTTAQATTAIVAAARLSNVFARTRKRAAIAITTVVPDTITVRPEVRDVRSSAS
jgi:hypothetical protein